jgi:hypothetical protein
MYRSVLRAALPLILGRALLGCDKQYDVTTAIVTEVPRPPDLFAVMTTDLRTPEDIDSLRVEQLYADADIARWSQGYELGPTDLLLPAAAYMSSDSRVRARVTAWKGASALVVDEAMVDFPTTESMAFELRLDRACLGQVIQSGDGTARSSCPTGQTCSGGSCVPIDRNRELRAWTGDVDAALAAAPLGDQ